MVLIRLGLAPPKTPYVGKDRWTLPLASLNNKTLLQQITTLEIELQTKLTSPPPQPDEHHIQQLWQDFKMSVTTLAKEAAKTQLSCLENCIKTLKQKIQQVEQHPDIDQQEPL
ncbi:hypothetical protein V8E55_010026 [Tylopilus felleus]